MDTATETSSMAHDTKQLAPASEDAYLVDKTSTFGAVRSGLAGIEFTGTGLVISTPTVSEEDYNDMFNMVLSLNKSCHWLLGDALLLGDTQWGNQYTESKYDDARKATGLSLSTLRNIVHLQEVPPQRTSQRPELYASSGGGIYQGFTRGTRKRPP